MSPFAGKVVVITGAGSGIGRALAGQFAAEGARLALSDINRAGLDETLALLPKECEARGYTFDVSARDAVIAHAADVQRDFGTAHYIINNAGATVVGTVANTSLEEYDWLLGINLFGVLYGTKAFLPMMLAQREGCIVNISSVFGMVGYPLQSGYNISKFGVRGLTECLWRELEGSGVRAVCVHPGGIATNIDKSGRRVRNAGAEEEKFSALADKMLTTPASKCAADILQGLRKGRKRIITGNGSTTMYWLSRLLPNHYHAVLKLVVG